MSAGDQGAILKVDRVSHAFGARQALNGVSLEVRAGEVYALLGPNGAGKTTLVRIVCGRLKPGGGTVRIDGRDPFADPKARAALGLTPQALALYPWLGVAENLQAFGRLAGLRGEALRRAVGEAMEVTRLTDRARTPVRHLSGGYQRRANIAAAILAKPRLLVLDEPTVGVDLAAREAVSDVLKALRAEDVAILLVTHDLDQATALADRVGFLREGEKVLEGAPVALIADAFGTRMEVEVALRSAAETPLALRLTGEGLAPGREAGAWTCLAADGYGRAAELSACLADVDVREIRVRRPSLEQLVARLAGRAA